MSRQQESLKQARCALMPVQAKSCLCKDKCLHAARMFECKGLPSALAEKPAQKLDPELLLTLLKIAGVLLDNLYADLKRLLPLAAQDDPCPGCQKGVVCKTPTCGRLKLPVDHPCRSVQPAQQEPVAYIRKDELQKAVNAPMLCRVTPEPRPDRIGIYTAPPQQEPPTDAQQIAEALRCHGLTLVKTASGYAVLKLGQITANQIKDQP